MYKHIKICLLRLEPLFLLFIDTARSFMKRSKLGQYNKEEMQKKEAELEKKLAEEKALAEAISVGARCEVHASGQPNKRGTVMFVGEYILHFSCLRLLVNYTVGKGIREGTEKLVNGTLYPLLIWSFLFAEWP